MSSFGVHDAGNGRGIESSGRDDVVDSSGDGKAAAADDGGASPSPFDRFTGSPGTTRRVVRTERLRGPLIAGGVLCVVGLLAAIAGGLLLSATQGAEILAATGRAEVGDPITFDAEDRSYALVFMPSIPNHDGYRRVAMSNLVCDITGPDGSVQTVRGSRQDTAIVTDFGWSIGSFDAVPGRSEVRCSFRRDPGGTMRNYALAPERSGTKAFAVGMSTIGLVAMLIGGVIVAVGWRGRSVVERLPADDTA